MKKTIRRVINRILGQSDPNLKSWMRPCDTIQPRLDALDMAICNVQIGARVEWERRQRGDDATGGAGSLLGDYAEFGVFRGNTFMHAHHRARQRMPWMRFFAFDSFQGLPALAGHDANGEFWEGQFACSQEEFTRNLRDADVELSKVILVPGWYKDTLTDEVKQAHDLQIVSIAYIDCDLYESCLPVLTFLTDLVRQGTVLLFDDWFAFKGDAGRGVQRATSEWLAAAPHIHLAPFHPFSHHGLSFVVSVDDTCLNSSFDLLAQRETEAHR